MLEKVLIIDIDNYLHRLYSVNMLPLKWKIKDSNGEDTEEDKYTPEQKLEIITANSWSIFWNLNNLLKNKTYDRIIGCYDKKDSKSWNSKLMKDIVEKYNLDTTGYKEWRKKDTIFFEYKSRMLNMFYFNWIKLVWSDFYEADDIIGTFAKKNEKKWNTVDILTIDKDLFQVINNNINVIESISKNKENRYWIEWVKAWSMKKYGIPFTPEQIPLSKTILWDKSDAILWIKGVGKKTLKKDMDNNNQEIESTDIYKKHKEFINDLLKVIDLNVNIEEDELNITHTNFNEDSINKYRKKIWLSEIDFEELEKKDNSFKIKNKTI